MKRLTFLVYAKEKYKDFYLKWFVMFFIDLSGTIYLN